MDFYVIVLQLAVVLLFLYSYFQRKLHYWSDRGVIGPTQDLWRILTGKELPAFTPFVHNLAAVQAKYGTIMGRVRFFTPVLAVNDAEWIKQLMIKDFHVFMNKPHLRTWDELWNLNLFNAEGDAWKRIRTITSPTFTSGKLRGMHRLMNRCVDMFVESLNADSDKHAGNVNIKQLVTGFTIDVIASTSFATETNANSTPDNPLVEHGLKFFRFRLPRIYSAFILPRWWNALFDVRSQFEAEHFDYFGNLLREIVRQRKSGQVGKRNDFVQSLMDAFVYESELSDDDYEKLTADVEQDEMSPQSKVKPTSAKNTLTESEIIAQCLIFFIAGFETTGSTIVYCLYELAHNPEIQDRLHAELKEAVSRLEVNSDEYCDIVMNHIPYLDAVMKETLRKYPPLLRLERRCGTDGYQVAGIPLEKDTIIEISTYSVHHNPDYYPEPERFNPDRFMPENKHLLVPYTYLPFGTGPRNCIGMRFAYQEIKLCLTKLITQFRFEPTAETPSQLEFVPGSLILTCSPFQLHITKR